MCGWACHKLLLLFVNDKHQEKTGGKVRTGVSVTDAGLDPFILGGTRSSVCVFIWVISAGH